MQFQELANFIWSVADLLRGDYKQADYGKIILMESDTLAEQAKNNTEEQFALGDFKNIMTDIIIEGQDAHNNIAEQLLKDDRIFAAMRGMLAKMVFQAFAQNRQGL